MSEHFLKANWSRSSIRSNWMILKGNCHEQFNLKKTAWTFQVWFKAASIQGKTTRIWRVFMVAKEITTDKRADFVNEKWSENLACCHKRLYLNACAAHDCFPLIVKCMVNLIKDYKSLIVSNSKHGNMVMHPVCDCVKFTGSTSFCKHAFFHNLMNLHAVIFTILLKWLHYFLPNGCH